MSHAALKASLVAAMLGASLAAHAADLYEAPGPSQAPFYAVPYDAPPPAYAMPQPYGPPPLMRERLGGGFEHCRVFHRADVDPYGREILHRVRVCDEPVALRAPGWAPPLSYGYGPPPYEGRQPARAIGPDFDDQ